MLIILATEEATSPPYEQGHARTQTHRQWQKHARRVGKQADGGQPGLHLTDRKIKQKTERTGGTYGVSSGTDPAVVNHTHNHLPGRQVGTTGRWAHAQRRSTCRRRKKRTNPSHQRRVLPFTQRLLHTHRFTQRTTQQNTPFCTHPSHCQPGPLRSTPHQHGWTSKVRVQNGNPIPQRAPAHAASLHLVTPAAGSARTRATLQRANRAAGERHAPTQ